MIFKTDEDVIANVKNHIAIPPYIITARETTKHLKALIKGVGFAEELINRIEHIEGKKKAIARKKYARSIKDLFARLLRPIDNVYHSTGGSKTYNIKNPKQHAELVRKIMHVRGGKSLEKWLETFWMPQYHSDPSGVIFLEYTTNDGKVDVWPTYKSINRIRAYDPNGQKLEWILFEPVQHKIDGKTVQIWRLVDDVKDYFILQQGDMYSIITEETHGFVTFEHPFGEVPALINSDLIDIDVFPHQRQSPIEPIDELVSDLARDLSVLNIYKFQKGFPIHWRFVTMCKTCKGTKKDGSKRCKECDGHGYYKSADVTDMVTLPTPKEGETSIAPDIAGFISPDLATWNQFKEDIQDAEDAASKTHWGAVMDTQKKKTATEVIIDTQPAMNKLNVYTDVAEMMENTLTEWYANALDPNKDKKESISEVSYGRRFIIDPPDVILEKYNKAKEAGDNNTILDRILGEYITAKYKSDPVHLRIQLIKLEVEPYIHLTLEEVEKIFGKQDTQKKVLFTDWWKTLTRDEITKNTPEKLTDKFNEWYNEQIPEEDLNKAAQIELRGSVGGIDALVEIVKGVSLGEVSEEAAVKIMVGMYGIDEKTAKEIAKKDVNTKHLEE